jgi:hypothetical protein
VFTVTVVLFLLLCSLLWAAWRRYIRNTVRRGIMESRKREFYVQQGCCLSCDVPQAVAPTLVGWRDIQNSTDCYWIRPPRSPDELEYAIKVIYARELDCHRYAGTDPEGY